MHQGTVRIGVAKPLPVSDSQVENIFLEIKNLLENAKLVAYFQWCGPGTGRIRIQLGSWIRIRIQRYKMKGKAEFFSSEIMFFKSEPKKSS